MIIRRLVGGVTAGQADVKEIMHEVNIAKGFIFSVPASDESQYGQRQIVEDINYVSNG